MWHDSVVQKMLCNEKYIGDAILQKTYIADLFTREKRVNNGELPKYYVHDCHPAIIDRETFQKVQEELGPPVQLEENILQSEDAAREILRKVCAQRAAGLRGVRQPLSPGDLDAERGQTGRLAVPEPAGAWQEDL